MITVQIIEDNVGAAKMLREILSEHKELEVLPCASSIDEGERAIIAQHPSLVFLDVELPDGNGIEFWEGVRNRIPGGAYVIFYTAYDKYMIDALRAQAHDFLLKPVVKKDVEEALNRFYIKCADNQKQTSDNTESNALLVLDHFNNRVVIKLRDVGYFQYISERKLWEAHCSDGNRYVLRHGTNSSFLLGLCPKFEQVHKSFIVNISYISHIEPNDILLLPPFKKGESIPLSKNFRTTLYARFCQL